MSLTDRFARYLCGDARHESAQLAAELGAAGYTLESSSLERFAKIGPHRTTIELPGNPWAGHRCWVGPRPPGGEVAGEIWMDTVEVVPMLLLPDEKPDPNERYSPEALASFQPFRAWMSTRPVANWQYHAFLQCAQMGPRPVQLKPPIALFDRVRSFRGDETEPVTAILADEAFMYASWFGKLVCGQSEWLAAERFLGTNNLDCLWSSVRREWGERFTEGINAMISPATMNLDWGDEYDSEDAPPEPTRIFYGEWEAPDDITFRTAVNLQFGLISRLVGDPLSPLNVDLISLVKR